MTHLTGIERFDSYVLGVQSGEIEVCKWVRLAVQRHVKDMARDDWEYYFEPKAAMHFIDFVEGSLAHYEGIVAGKPFILETWQVFIFGSLFGWLKKERMQDMAIRRFRNSLLYVPKKNGKSLMSAATALYMMDGDDYPGAQCYILAKNQKHASELGYRAAVAMTEQSPKLSKQYRVNRSAGGMGIYFDVNNSFYKPITSKPDSEDGRNVHFCGPDETKDWTDFEIHEVMKNGTVNAPNSLFFETTTAGPNQDSLGYVQQKRAEQILNGMVDDEQTFAIVYTVDEEDRSKSKAGYYLDERLWKKANPNYGVSVFADTLRELANDAKASESKRIAFETKHLNIWHTSVEGYIPDVKWNACGKETFKGLEAYKGRRAYAGLDLGSVDDFTAFILAFEPESGDVYDVVPFFWIPEDSIRERKNKSVIQEWVYQGLIRATEGDVMDHRVTLSDILEIASKVELIEIAYDRYKMTEMIVGLQDAEIELAPFGQGFVSMNAAVDNLETMVSRKEIEHFGNPVLAWMLSNVAIAKDPAGNRKFNKAKSQDKIDGIVALGMALQRAKINEGNRYSEWTDFKVF